jgi:indole-3-glycerol phosphate synthase
MTFDTILAATRAESDERQRQHPLPELQREIAQMGATCGFARALRSQAFSVIAEIKRRSPSMGEINPAALETAHGIYREHPLVSAISILTQNAHFGGSPEDLRMVRELTLSRPKPLLRKDFIFSAYEIYYSRWIGADAILLMANVVRDPREFKALHDLALSLGLDVLCEVHEAEEIRVLPDTVQICGINSRRFKGVDQKQLAGKAQGTVGAGPSHDTQTDLNTFALFSELPANAIKIAESGISSENVRSVLARYPFNAALIGTSLLKSDRQEMAKHLDRIRDEAAAVRGPIETRRAPAVAD